MTGEESARIIVRVQPNARRNEVVRFDDGALHVKIAAPPVKGKANSALLDFLSDILGVSKSHLSIEKGVTSRMKVITIEGMSLDEFNRLVLEFLG
jgi:uncharacterized protein (TIGR00251 family)